MKRVLLVMTAREVGGAERYVARLTAALSGQCRFTVVLSDHPDLSGLRHELAATARVLAMPFERPEQLPQVGRRLVRLAAEHDLVHLNSNHPASRLGIWLGWLLPRARKPVISVEHRVTPLSDIAVPTAIAWALPTLFRWSRRRCARVIAVSQENRRMLETYYRLPAAQIEVVSNGVDVQAFATPPPAPAALRLELGLVPDQPLILTVGRLAPNKGHRYLIAAAPSVLQYFPDARFVLAGPALPGFDLAAEIAAADLTSHFSLLGHRDDIAQLLHACDLLVLPSLAEGFALTLLEGLAAGAITISTRVGGADEIITSGENGFLVPIADAENLAEATIRALRLNHDERQQLSAKAHATAEHYSLQATAAKMLALYENISAR